jgi:hypothetical protein
MLRAGLAFALLCAGFAPSAAQAPRSIDPGMSETKVVERLGQPDASRSSGDFKYLFYHNGCIRQCGMDDVVILRRDSVVDAMFRSTDRSYNGKSSSPRAIPADVAARTRPGARDVPSGEVVQAGMPKVESAPTPESKPDSAAKAEAKTDSATAPAPEPKKVKRQSAPKPEPTKADSTRHDTVTGTLRIPVKPQHHSAKVDSTRADSASRPPHHD